MNIAGLLLAAGRGRRFDPAGERNKLLQVLPGGEPVAGASARALLAVLPRVIAVVRPGDTATTALLGALGCEIAVCEDAGSGMAASLVCGVRAAQDAQGWLVALADMPYVQPSTIAALVREVAQGALIAAPVHAGRRGNPVAFGRAHLHGLLALEGDQGARGVLKNNIVNELAVDDPGILQDIDTPSDIHEK